MNQQLQLPLTMQQTAGKLGAAVMEIMAAHAGGRSPILAVTKARKQMIRKATEVLAQVIMFDGRPALLSVWWRQDVHGISWSGHKWIELPGGAIELVHNEWARRVSQAGDRP